MSGRIESVASCLCKILLARLSDMAVRTGSAHGRQRRFTWFRQPAKADTTVHLPPPRGHLLAPTYTRPSDVAFSLMVRVHERNDRCRRASSSNSEIGDGTDSTDEGGSSAGKSSSESSRLSGDDDSGSTESSCQVGSSNPATNDDYSKRERRPCSNH